VGWRQAPLGEDEVAVIDRRAVLRCGVLGLAWAGSTVGVRRLAADTPTVTTNSSFVERYRGRVIRGYLPVPGIGPLRPQLFIDDAELHVMTTRTGRFTSVLNHYQTFPDLRSTGHAAVDGLRGADLVPHP
jgi:hypothetical protein